MSGGSFNYNYALIRSEYCGRMEDVELDDMMDDLADLLHDLEWWKSGDYSEEDYRNTVKSFKAKWFNQTQGERLNSIVDKKCNALKRDIERMISHE